MHSGAWFWEGTLWRNFSIKFKLLFQDWRPVVPKCSYHNNPRERERESEIRSAEEAESQVERACVKAGREREINRDRSGNARCSASAVSVADQRWTLASSWHPDRPDRTAASQNARLYNSHLSPSLFMVMSLALHFSRMLMLLLFLPESGCRCRSRPSGGNLVLSALVMLLLSDQCGGLHAPLQVEELSSPLRLSGLMSDMHCHPAETTRLMSTDTG